MPLIEDKQQQVQFARVIGQPEMAADNVDFGEMARAAFRTENSLGALITRESGLPDSVVNDESFNPWDHMTEDEKLDESFTSHVATADNLLEMDAVRRQVARERKDRQVLAEGGADSFFAQMAVGVLDPINFIPVGGTAYKTYRNGSSIMKAAAVTGGVASGTQAAVEASLHYSQLERTYGESALNVGFAGLLGGTIGAIPPALKEFLGPKSQAEFADSMNPEPKVSKGQNSILPDIEQIDIDEVKISLLEEAKEQLIPLAGNKLSRGEVKGLRSTVQDLQTKLNRIGDATPQEIAEELEQTKAKGKSARKAKAEAKQRVEDSVEESRLAIQEQIDLAESKLESNEIAVKAEADLSRAEQGILPEEFQKTLDEIIKESELAKEASLRADEPVITEPTGESRSVGAAQVNRDIRVQGKIARALTKALGFDPLSRSLTSDLQQTRQLAVELAENPIAMESKSGEFVANSVESAAKVKDGLYYQAIDGHTKAYNEYRKGGGVLNNKEFKELVAKELRNPTSTDPQVIKAAESWRNNLYEPLKKEMVDADLLPADVEVSTAANYLNRLWNKDKIKSRMDEFVNVVSTWLREQDGSGQDVGNFNSLAREIATRITGTPDGRLPYDYKIGENSAKGGGRGAGLAGPLKERSFNIPDALIDDFLENDIEVLGGRYLRSLATDIELVKRFDDVNMTRQIKEMSEAWNVKIQEASKTSEKEARKFSKQKERDIESIAAMRNRMRGTYGMVDPDNFWVRAGRTARDLNYLRFMGGVAVSSIPDVARIVMAEGIAKTFSKGLKPLLTKTKSFKVAAEEAKKYGIGTDVLMGGRSEIIADVADYSQGGTAFERGVRSAAQSFGRVNLMDFWTAGIKQLHAVTAQTSMADTLTKGGYEKRFAQMGISEANGKLIAKQLKEYGQKIDDVWVANTRLWDDQDLAEIWSTGLRKESDRVIVVPGQEKPLFMSSELGKTILQFRSFMFSSTQRMLISGIQGQDAHFMQGVIGLVTLGMMSYAFKQWDADRPLSDDPRVWVSEGIDRSGVTGILMEMNNTVEKVSANNFGLRPLLGIATPASRFASRSQAEAFLGPTFGSMLSTVMTVSGGAADGDLSESDVRAIRRLLPYQNLLIFRQGIDKMEEEFK